MPPKTVQVVGGDVTPHHSLIAETLRAVNGARASPSAFASVIDSEAGHIDAENILSLPGWERGIRLRDGKAGYSEAAGAMRRQAALPPLVHTAELQKAADSCALRMADLEDVNAAHPPRMGLMQHVKLYAKIGGMLQMNLSRGFFDSGDSVAVSWLVADGDAERGFRDTVLRKEAGHFAVGAACGRDKRVYVVGLFADNCWAHDEHRNAAAMLVSAYDADEDGFLSWAEYQALCKDLALHSLLDGNDESDFEVLCATVNALPEGPDGVAMSSAPQGRLSEQGLRKILGGDEFLRDKKGEIGRLVAAKRAGKVAVRQSNSVNHEKSKQQAVGSNLTVNKAGIVAHLQKLWRAKKGDVLDEMLANYKSPLPEEDTQGRLMVFAEISRCLQDQVKRDYPTRNRIELLNMLLYTMAGPDIDSVMSFTNVPAYNENNMGEWDAYQALHKDERNGAMFSQINWAMRTVNCNDYNSEAWDTVQKWVKTICLLAAICNDSEVSLNDALSRGLAGLPPAVVDVHAALNAGHVIDWAAPSSCATDPGVAQAYVLGQAANAQKTSGGCVFFSVTGTTHGIPLQSVSKYPREAEVLLSPLSSFKVHYRGTKAELPKDVICVEMRQVRYVQVMLCSPFHFTSPAHAYTHDTYSGTTPADANFAAFLKDCLAEAEAAVPRLLKTSEDVNTGIPSSLADTLKYAFAPPPLPIEDRTVYLRQHIDDKFTPPSPLPQPRTHTHRAQAGHQAVRPQWSRHHAS